ncbi:Anoctamin-7 [Actinomortierella wolfii]|nr:Anoctamin-7 [Actinomortierella wolfii]
MDNTVIDLAALSQQQRRPNQAPSAPSSAAGQVSGGTFVPVPHAPGRSRQRNRRRRRTATNANDTPTDAATTPAEKAPCPRHMPGHAPNKFVNRSLGQKRVLSLFYASDVALLDAILAFKRDNPEATVDDAIDAFDEYQSADALANIVYETQAFDMVFKYPIPEHLRKVSQDPPVIETTTKLSDIDLDSQSSGAQRRRNEKLEQERQIEELKRQATIAQEQQKEQLLQEKREAGQLGWTHIDVPPETDGTKSAQQIEDERLEKERYRFKKALMKENLIIEEEPDIDGEEMYVKVYTPFWRLCVEAQRQRWKAEVAQPIQKDAKSDSNSLKKHRFIPTFLAKLIHRADNVSLPLRAESLPFKASQLRQYALAEKTRRWSDIVRHGGGVTAKGGGVGSNMGKDGRDGFFGTGQRGALTESIIMYAKIHTRRGDRLALQYVMKHKALTDMFTLHDGSYKSKVKPNPNRRTLLYHNWVRSWHSQPLEEIRFYFGEKIALYFAWIEHYTRWLWSAAIAGTLFLIFGVIHYFAILAPGDSALTGLPSSSESKRLLIRIFDNPLTLPYTIFMSIWATMFFEFWKRKSNVLAYRWNMLDYERRERARPEFKPTGVRISPITGKKELYYPRYKQLVSLVISIIVVLIAIAIVIVSVGSLMFFNVWLRTRQREKALAGESALNSTAVTVITAVLNLVVIVLLGTIYAKVAKILTDAENHKRRTQYEDSLILKRFLFDFVNFYSALFYIAYFKETAGSEMLASYGLVDACDGSCMGDLTIQLAIVFVGKQFINQVQEVAIPLFHRYWNEKEELAQKAKLVGKYKEKANKIKPPQWTKDDKLPTYAPEMFEEYRELVIQFGFCTLFVTAFPIAPIFALLNNLLEIRVDAYKLLTQHRRPVSQSAQDIGSWSKILAFITHIAVLTNGILIAFQSEWMEKNFFGSIPWVIEHDARIACIAGEEDTCLDLPLLSARLLFVFIYEHIIFLIKIGLSYMITDMPGTVKLAVERESYYTRLALDEEEPALDEVLDDQEDDDTDDDSGDEDDLLGSPISHTPKDEKRKSGSKAGGAEIDNDQDSLEGEGDDNEEQEMSELLAKHGGCGCAAQGDGHLGTVLGGYEGTWLSKIRNKELAQQRQQENHTLRHRSMRQQQAAAHAH